MDSKERARWVSTCIACNTSAIFLFMRRVLGGGVEGKKVRSGGEGREIPPGWKSLKTIAWQFDLFNAHAILIMSPSQFCIL